MHVLDNRGQMTHAVWGHRSSNIRPVQISRERERKERMRTMITSDGQLHGSKNDDNRLASSIHLHSTFTTIGFGFIISQRSSGVHDRRLPPLDLRLFAHIVLGRKGFGANISSPVDGHLHSYDGVDDHHFSPHPPVDILRSTVMDGACSSVGVIDGCSLALWANGCLRMNLSGNRVW